MDKTRSSTLRENIVSRNIESVKIVGSSAKVLIVFKVVVAVQR